MGCNPDPDVRVAVIVQRVIQHKLRGFGLGKRVLRTCSKQKNASNPDGLRACV